MEARRLLHGPGSRTEAAQLPIYAADRAAALGWIAWVGDWAEAADQLARCFDQPVIAPFHMLFGGPVFLPLQVDALLRLGRAEEATARVDAAAALYRPPARFFEAAMAAARFRLKATSERAAPGLTP